MADPVISSLTSKINGNLWAATTSAAKDETTVYMGPVPAKKVEPAGDKCYFGAWLGIMPREGSLSDDIVLDPTLSYPRPIASYKMVTYRREIMEVFRKTVKDFAGLTGKDPAIVMAFTAAFDGYKYVPFPTVFCKEMSAQGKIPMVTWEMKGLPFKISDNSTYLDEFNRQMSDKKGPIYDYVVMWAKQAAAYGKPFLLRPFHEMNLMKDYDWTAWMNGGEAGVAKFKDAWRSLYGVFQSIAPNATFVWCVEGKSGFKTEWNTIDRYNPNYDYDAKTKTYAFKGDYFDWAGIDSYRKNGDQNTFESVFNDPHGISAPWKKMKKTKNITSMEYLASLGKPLIICETSSIPDGGKAGFVSDLFAAKVKYGLSGIIWFNENKTGMGAAEFNWPVDAPISIAAEEKIEKMKIDFNDCASVEGVRMVFEYYKVSIPAETETMLAQAKTEKDVKKAVDAYLEMAGSSKVPFKNPVLDSLRIAGASQEQFYYNRVPVTVNDSGLNVQTKLPVVKPPVMKAFEEDVKTINKNRTPLGKVAGHLTPDGQHDLAISMAEAQEGLAGYQSFAVADTSDAVIDILPFINSQHMLSVNEYSMIPYGNRNYLKALAKKKDVYAAWEEKSPESKDNIFNKCDSTCDLVISLASDPAYIGRFDNKVLNKFGGLFDLLDTKRYKDREPLGLLASAYATKADIRIAKGDISGAEVLYKKADNIMKGEIFQRWQIQNTAEDAFLKIIDNKDPKKAWWEPLLKAAAKPVYRLNFLDFYFFADPDKDLKATITIGKAAIILNNSNNMPAKIDEGIQMLEPLAFGPAGISPAIQMKAKFELAKGLALYGGLTNASQAMAAQYREKARKAIDIFKQLLSTELASKAQKEIDAIK